MSIQPDEEKVVKEQCESIGDLGEDLLVKWKEIEEQKNQAGIIAKDADLLEIAFTAKEYMEMGFRAAGDWLDKISKKLRTQSAKKLTVSSGGRV